MTDPSTREAPLAFDRPAPPSAIDWAECGLWPCRWIHVQGENDRPLFAVYRLTWQQAEPRVAQVFASADERYELYLDGRRIGRGPQRGDTSHWRYEAYDLHLTPGPHVLIAHAWSLGDMAPWAQFCARHGFLLQPRDADLDAILGTGIAPWQARRCEAIRAVVDPRFTPVGPAFELDGAKPSWELSTGGWHTPLPAHHGAHAASFNNERPIHLLVPAELPAMLDEPIPLRDQAVVRFVEEIAPDQDVDTLAVDVKRDLATEHRAWQDMLAGCSGVRVEPGHARRVIIDLQNYFCAYPVVTLRGGTGGVVEVGWAETLLTQCNRWEGKGPRGVIDGHFFNGLTDRFLTPGGNEARRLEVPWWRSGRFVQLVVRPASETIEIVGLELRETRYPLEMHGRFTCRSAEKTWPRGIAETIPVALRGLQMCAHETYLDCPYYEQLMYVGDTRLQALTGYAIDPDDRLQRKALATFDASRRPDGLTQSRYPSWRMQIIPPFSLWWIGMVHDFARWRDAPGLVRALLPGVHAVLEAFLLHQRPDGLVELPGGWNFTDWVRGWRNGVGPKDPSGLSGLVNWQLILALQEAAELDEQAGEPELAARWRRLAQQIGGLLVKRFWDESHGLLADD
ncbi:MAG: hypothetical protein IT441_03310, partial [Phycisphaeraceae bacterium]|nr:hypothetical protein [Phycisphaeraceae bacterium]